MGRLIDPKETVEILKKYDFIFSKRYGQNFLIDEHVLGKILRAADITKEDAVLEIGPGIGTMTQALADAAGQVVAVEIDEKLLPILSDTLQDFQNVTVVHADILETDIRELSRQYAGGKPFKVVANLPYYITTPIIMGLLENDLPVTSITVMVQKEVAQRMQEKPGSKDYGALSLAVQYYAEPYLAANVPRNCFMPRPDVDSAVIRLTKRPEPAVKVQDPKLMFRLIRASFSVRRKTLLNGLKNAGDLGYSASELTEAVKALGKGETVRGETLSLQEFAFLSDTLSAMRNG
ncbi:MAG: 16S rRNA (adenine(1518)-N(6)/adenine(1519)-N(6))-dimethyltransferase RsmA [Lachnospiraceae bacterium]|nr:16S rRNA (adenine(1518)-N(6)/adenine(1519)-N(6))-dimethyltransferase RsmA [Lachnospiraceae bacterium]